MLYRSGDFVLKDGPLKTPYKNAPRIGSSISISDNSWATGTFGGYVELFTEQSSVKVCGLTCHHVLRPPQQLNAMTLEFFSEL